jgi:hypothetical protein
MGFFRREPEETENERLMREAGLSDGDTPSSQDPPEPATELERAQDTAWADALERAYARPAVWDLVATVEVPGIPGETVQFSALQDGELIVDTEAGDADLSPLADTVEERLPPPYTVQARRESDGSDTWAVAARTIDVVELVFDGGDEIELIVDDDTELRVDGEPSDAEIPELEQARSLLGGHFVVQLDRLDGDLWELRASAL